MPETAISPVVTTQLPSDEERERLTADFEDCRKEVHAAADELLHPRHSIDPRLNRQGSRMTWTRRIAPQRA